MRDTAISVSPTFFLVDLKFIAKYVGVTNYFCTFAPAIKRYAAIAQLVEHNLAKVGVASSSLVCRSFHIGNGFKDRWQRCCRFFYLSHIQAKTNNDKVAAMVELVDTRDLKSLGQ